MAANEIRRETPAHDDMIVLISTGILGANQWLVANFRDTLFPLKYLRNNSNDFFCVEIQSPHWRKQGENLDSIHIHYILDTPYTGGQTILFDVYYTWLMPNQVVPALSGWSQATSVSIVPSAGNLAQYTYLVDSLVTNFAPPANEGYGIGMLIRLVRGNGTYTGNIAITSADVHALRDRSGSQSEFSDL